MEGTHILANFYNCNYDFNDESELLDLAINACNNVGLTVLGHAKHFFQPQGFTFVILLAESHLSLHTWPENKTVVFDIYTCNFSQDNTGKTVEVYQTIKNKLKPLITEEKIISRDSLAI